MLFEIDAIGLVKVFYWSSNMGTLDLLGIYANWDEALTANDDLMDSVRHVMVRVS